MPELEAAVDTKDLTPDHQADLQAWTEILLMELHDKWGNRLRGCRIEENEDRVRVRLTVPDEEELKTAFPEAAEANLHPTLIPRLTTYTQPAAEKPAS